MVLLPAPLVVAQALHLLRRQLLQVRASYKRLELFIAVYKRLKGGRKYDGYVKCY